MRTAIFPAQYKNLEDMCQFVVQAAKDAGLGESDTCAVELAVDEACSNIIEHAYGVENGGEIECTCETEGDSLTVILRDHGKPFEPERVKMPDITAKVEDRTAGGLGIYMIKKLMDEVRFEALGDAGNLLTLIKRKGKE
jgi:serine/threonine-protein kinase RsbW